MDTNVLLTQGVREDSLPSEGNAKDHTKKGEHVMGVFTQKSVLTLIGTFFLQMVVGTQYAWGNYYTYITGYYRDLGNEVTLTEFYAIWPIILMFTTLFFLAGVVTVGLLSPKVYYLLLITFVNIKYCL
jgi:hypothetical protein